MIIIVNYCSLSILHLVLCLLRHKGKHLFSPILKPLLITQCYGTTISFMQLQQINQWRQRSCTAYGWKACQNGRGIWLYNAGIRQGSSDFFSFFFSKPIILKFSQYVVCIFGHKTIYKVKNNLKVHSKRRYLVKKIIPFQELQRTTRLDYKVVFLYLWYHKALH